MDKEKRTYLPTDLTGTILIVVGVLHFIPEDLPVELLSGVAVGLVLFKLAKISACSECNF